jgi:hypothetical protein
MTGGDLSSENIRNSYLKWNLFSLLSLILGLMPRGQIRAIFKPVPQRSQHRVRAVQQRGMIFNFLREGLSIKATT